MSRVSRVRTRAPNAPDVLFVDDREERRAEVWAELARMVRERVARTEGEPEPRDVEQPPRCPPHDA